MEEKTFVGYGYGKFQNDRGEMQPYCNVFVLENFNGTENADYHSAARKLLSTSVFPLMSGKILRWVPG